MENLSSDAICRTCMSKGQNFHLVMKYESMSKLRISEMLMTTVPQLHIQPEDDGLPIAICGVCLNKLNIAYHYQQLCIQTDRRLKSMLLHDQEDSDDEQQQEDDHLDIETKQKKVLLLKETAPDPLVHNDSGIKIENESECREFLSDHEDDRDDLFKRSVVYTAPADTRDDGEDDNGNESDVEWNDDIDEAEFESKEFLSVHEKDRDHIFKATAVDKTLTETREEDDDNETDKAEIDIKLVKPHHNKTGANEFEKPDVRYPCPDCLKDFDHPHRLRRHIVVHSIKRLHECDICKYRFSTENYLKRHKTRHNSDASAKKETPSDDYNCPECPLRFEKHALLSAHLQSRHRANPKQMFQCEYCPKKFIKITQLRKHAHVHPENQKFKCHFCSKVFQKNASLNEHINTHTGETPNICLQCGKSFAHRSGLRQHILRHADEKRFCCKQCPSKFSCSSYLSKHMVVHRTYNAHICDICGSSFSRSYTLNKHKQTHSGDRPYKCEECNMSFALRDYLRLHMRKHTEQKQQCQKSY